ncbi:CTP synthase [Candidatus Poribacteria bacterium]|nr:CTP synthase [Candidatus Poribacteria bacterium]
MPKQPKKFIFVTGGVVSSVGKGITTASVGRLLVNRGFNVTPLKVDPYLNVDAGTMNPYQHGEVFVTHDGAETDLDLGHYERFIGKDLNRESNFTTGSVYGAVIAKERRGEYLGKTVQLIPHITDEIKNRIYMLADDSDADVMITEIGGTIGDFETPPFTEAIRQVRLDVGKENTLFIHVSLIAYVGPWGETKTKPTQHSVRALMGIGIVPDILICRSKEALTEEHKDKISLFCSVPREAVIEARDTKEIYDIPLIFERQGLANLIIKRLGLPDSSPDTAQWSSMVKKIKNPKETVVIAIVGKYTEHGDAYMSITEALKHGGAANETCVEIKWIESDDLQDESNIRDNLRDVHGLLVPGGFGYRGIEGKINAVKYTRENKLPYLGLCLGMQCATIEFARNVLGMEKANSSEFDPQTPYPVIHLMAEQEEIEDMGGTMRLGTYLCVLDNQSKSYKEYGIDSVGERHRHRFEFNNKYRDDFTSNGFRLSGLSPDGQLVELIELDDHPWFIASQFHPEFRSKPLHPHPLFRGFIAAALRQKANK